MKRRVLLFGLGLFLFAMLSPSAAARDSLIDLTLVYSNNINGEIRPCPT